MAEEKTENYRFFHLMSAYMRGMEKVPDDSKAQTARSRLIEMITMDKSKFTGVSFPFWVFHFFIAECCYIYVHTDEEKKTREE